MDRQADEEVIGRLKALQSAVGAGGPYFDPYVASRAQDDLRRAQERMRLGLDTTVAVLVGGTGSGKSTMFNAITELDFADSGDIRPTTERAAACTFDVDASELLDYLQVDPDRRIEHSSILTVGHDRLDGLVLLDLPDHDSVAIAHSAQVDRLLPMADVLIWIVDPQKYADEVLHKGFFESLGGRQEAMVVVMNQIDRVPANQRETLLGDLRNLLDRDGLTEVPILAASALTGDGVDGVRDVLARAVAGQSFNARTAAAELDAIAGRLRQNVGREEPAVEGEAVDDINDRIVRSSGIPSVVESIRASGRSYQAAALVVPEQPANTMVHAIRDAWVAHVRTGLPPVWQEAVTSAVSPADRFRRALGTAIRTTPLPAVSHIPAFVGLVGGVALAVAGVVLAVLGSMSTAVKVGVVVGGVLVGFVAGWLGKKAVARSAARAAAAYERDVREAMAQATQEHLVAGPREILDQHRLTREALDSTVFFAKEKTA
ncbi:GTP-binding protein [Trueperella abortisuis]|uniref:GTP-binding protein EngB required for normal cell division n=1 Tax=Trueperella abortisuis TaxID=445930 RepID=A0ABT9PK73_9ACTO|nr:GTP-binding protein [Trueperella abortisuis]MDP9832861.1 GTP-binding protein EngB required for normal cell division [Trueperella abortisuis]